ncbi:MAG: hypothetical protein SWJ54_22725, partial [Cyanobacteriota bacterium]|nr:hypothetical protein [Cyanobacteriota bacterium]
MSEDRFSSPYSKKPPNRPPKPNVLTTLSIRVLRGIIDNLEGVVDQLENPSSGENHPNRESRNKSLGYQLSRILAPIRRILPHGLNRRLPDPILAIAIVAILIVILSQIFKQFPDREPSLEIAETHLSENQLTETIIEKPLAENFPESLPEPTTDTVELTPPETLSDNQPQQYKSQPSPKHLPDQITEIFLETDEVESSPEPKAEIISEAEETELETSPEVENPNKIPETLVATISPEPVRFVSPKTLELTPEQYLIATIQAKMEEMIAKISPEIIEAVRANFSINRLQVELSDSWYELTEDQQNQLSQTLLKQAQNFDFTR